MTNAYDALICISSMAYCIFAHWITGISSHFGFQFHQFFEDLDFKSIWKDLFFASAFDMIGGDGIWISSDIEYNIYNWSVNTY